MKMVKNKDKPFEEHFYMRPRTKPARLTKRLLAILTRTTEGTMGQFAASTRTDSNV